MIPPCRNNNTQPTGAVLTPATSVYLDFLRPFAALLVFFYHASAERLNGQWLSGIGRFGHDAVCSAYIKTPQKLNYYIRYFAGMTFTLYLFHYPLLQLFGSIFSTSIYIVVLSLASVMLIAPVTEGQKAYWLRLINRIHSQPRKLLHNRY